LLTLLLPVSFAFAADDDKIVGLWNTQKTTANEIFKRGIKYCGRIAWLKEPLYGLTKVGHGWQTGC